MVKHSWVEHFICDASTAFWICSYKWMESCFISKFDVFPMSFGNSFQCEGLILRETTGGNQLDQRYWQYCKTWSMVKPYIGWNLGLIVIVCKECVAVSINICPWPKPIQLHNKVKITCKEYVAVSIDICPWQNPMRLGIKVKLLDKEEINTNACICSLVDHSTSKSSRSLGWVP